MYIYSNLIFHFERRRAHFIVPILCISMQVLNNYHLVHFLFSKYSILFFWSIYYKRRITPKIIVVLFAILAFLVFMQGWLKIMDFHL